MNENNKKLLELRVYKSQIVKEFTNVNDNFTI